MKVMICGVPHKVKYIKDVFDIDTHFGQIDYNRAEILINEDSTEEIKTETLCHEILHGIFVHIGRNDLATDETLVNALGNAIYQTFTVKVEE